MINDRTLYIEAGLELSYLGQRALTLRDLRYVGDKNAPPNYCTLFGRSAASKDASDTRIERTEFDGYSRDGHIIVAGAECLVGDQLIASNYAGPALTICNQYGDSSFAGCQQTDWFGCRFASFPGATAGPLRFLKSGAAAVTDHRFWGGGLSVGAPVKAAIEIDFQGAPGQFNRLELHSLRAECFNAEAFIRVHGDGVTYINGLRIQGGVVECGKYLLYAPGVWLVNPIIDAEMVRQDTSDALIVCAGIIGKVNMMDPQHFTVRIEPKTIGQLNHLTAHPGAAVQVQGGPHAQT